MVIKNNPMALVMQQDEEGHTLLVSSVDTKSGPKTKTSTLVSQLSFDQRDINVCMLIIFFMGNVCEAVWLWELKWYLRSFCWISITKSTGVCMLMVIILTQQICGIKGLVPV